MKSTLKLVSWNVNGIRAAAKKGFVDWLHATDADIIGLQEVRALADQIPHELQTPAGFYTHFFAGKRLGYSGVGLYSRLPFDKVEITFGGPEFDDEGRIQLAQFGKLLVANIYFPNGNGKDRDNGRIPYKLNFYRYLFDILERKQEAGFRVIVMGDFNTAHEEIDLARPKENRETSGFCQVERDELTRWIEAGYVDTFRQFHAEGSRYSWWSQRAGARDRNVGWRIDYLMASSSAAPFALDADIHSDVLGSDHCPVSLIVDVKILRP